MEFIKKYYLKTLFIIVYVVLGSQFLKTTISYFKDRGSYGNKGFILLTIALLALLSITMIILNKFNKGNIEKQFLIIGLIWGIAFAVINPPFLVPDEVVHINRSYDIAKGRFFYKANTDTMMLPSGIKEYDIKINESINKEGMRKYLDIMGTPLEKNNLIKYNADATGAYSVLAYIPQSIGLAIGNFLNLPTYFTLILGRITNLLVWVTLCYFALKCIPIRKELMFIIMCIPVAIQQAASFSPDALLNSSSFFVLAYILYLKFEKERVNYKDLGIIIGATILIGAVKIPYILIAGTLILIPNKKIKFGVGGKLIVLVGIVLINLLLMFSWKAVSKPRVDKQISNVQVDQESELQNNNDTDNKQVNIVDNIKTIIKNPKLFYEKITQSTEINKKFYEQSFTAFFGWFRVLAPENFIGIITFMIIFFAIKGDDSPYVLSIFDRSLYLLMTVGMYMLLCIVALQWMKIPLGEVISFTGIQGRYFYPFIIGIYMIFQNNVVRIKNSNFVSNTLRNFYVSWTLMFSLLLIVTTYFGI